MIGLGGLGLVAIVVGLAVGAQRPGDRLEDRVNFANAFGLSLLVPVVALVSPRRPSATRSRTARSCTSGCAPSNAGITVAAPPTWRADRVPSRRWSCRWCSAPGSPGAGLALIGGTAAAAVVAVVGYCGLFTWLGLRVRRALRGGSPTSSSGRGSWQRRRAGASRLALRAYTRWSSRSITGGSCDWPTLTMPFAVVVPLVVGVFMVWLTGRRLRRTDVT